MANSLVWNDSLHKQEFLSATLDPPILKLLVVIKVCIHVFISPNNLVRLGLFLFFHFYLLQRQIKMD